MPFNNISFGLFVEYSAFLKKPTTFSPVTSIFNFEILSIGLIFFPLDKYFEIDTPTFFFPPTVIFVGEPFKSVPEVIVTPLSKYVAPKPELPKTSFILKP